MPRRFDDLDYWYDYYSENKEPFEPSPFALHVTENYLQADAELLELGCGNGRDSLHLSASCKMVTAVDQCEPEIQFLNDHYGNPGLRFVAGDMTDITSIRELDGVRHSFVYSRFSLHSVPRDGQRRILDSADELLRSGGLVAFEFRGLKNELRGVGEAIGDDGATFVYQEHTRRFIDAEALATNLEARGFEVLELDERPGFSPTATTDETFARLVARRPAAGS